MVPSENGAAVTFCDSRHSIPVILGLNQVANDPISFHKSKAPPVSPAAPDGLA